MTAQMKRIEKAFHSNAKVALLSFTVTPWLDDVRILHKYGEKIWQETSDRRPEAYLPGIM
jgi:cytochrome oxidase Cu insertion factor (SCO1/SenC/PrrC family)